MNDLPFLTPPATPQKRRVGTTASGIVELPIYGGLTVGESSLITELLSKDQSVFVAGARKADAIAKAENISITEAFTIIESAVRGSELEPEAEAIRVRHAQEIEEVSRLYATAGQRNMAATVTALIRYRLEQPEWSLEDTNCLHRALFDGIWQLAEDEQKAEESEPAAPPDDEMLGKPPGESGRTRRSNGAN